MNRCPKQLLLESAPDNRDTFLRFDFEVVYIIIFIVIRSLFCSGCKFTQVIILNELQFNCSQMLLSHETQLAFDNIVISNYHIFDLI